MILQKEFPNFAIFVGKGLILLLTIVIPHQVLNCGFLDQANVSKNGAFSPEHPQF